MWRNEDAGSTCSAAERKEWSFPCAGVEAPAPAASAEPFVVPGAALGLVSTVVPVPAIGSSAMAATVDAGFPAQAPIPHGGRGSTLGERLVLGGIWHSQKRRVPGQAAHILWTS